MTSQKKFYSLKAINLLLVIAMMLAGVAVNVSPVRAAAGDITITTPISDEVVTELDRDVDVEFTVDSTDNSGAGQYRILVGEEVFGPYGATFTGGVAQAFSRTITIPDLADGKYNLKVEVKFLGETEWLHSKIAVGKVIVNNVDGIEITAPAESVSVKTGDTVTVSFTVDDLLGVGQYDILLDNNDDDLISVFTEPVVHTFEGGYNQAFKDISITIPSLDDGVYDLVVKAGVPNLLGEPDMATLEDILIVDNTIVAPVLTSPNGGEEWTIGSVHDITWEEYDPGEAVTISLSFSKDNGGTWSLIAADVPNADYSWTVPASATTGAKVKIEVVDGVGNKAADVSDAAFTIYAVDSTAPVVAMVAPEDGAIIGPSVTLQASAADPESGIASVYFERTYEGDWADSLGPVTFVDGHYELEITGLSAGSYYFRAVAENGIGLTAASEAVSVTVEVEDETEPVVTLIAPAPAAVVGYNYEFKVNAVDGESDVVSMDLYAVDTTPDPDVEVLLCEDVNPGELLDDGSRMFECTATAPEGTEGTVSIKAVVTNGAGLEGKDEADVIVDLVDPDLGDGLLTPAAGAVLQLGTSVDITWDTIDEDHPDSVDLELRRGGVTVLVIAENPSSPYNWTIAGAPGSDYEVCMIVTDEAGNRAEDCNSPITIWGKDATVPAVSLTVPAKAKGIVELKATASDPQTFIQKVEFFVSFGGAAFEKVGEDSVVPYDAGAEYGYAWDTTGFADGTYSIKAVATNGVGLQALAFVAGVVIDNTAPVLSHMQPSTAAPISGNVPFSITAMDSGVGIATDGVTFKYYKGGAWVAMEGFVSVVDHVYSVVFDTTGVDNGWLDIRVTAQDKLGNEDSFETAYFVQNGDPVEGQVVINLQVGWNLISMPLIPSDISIDVLLADLKDSGSVAQVVAWPYNVDSGKIVEMRWNGAQLTDITELKDGPGYWIEMTKPSVLVFEGTPLPEPPMAPPSYLVYAGWNLIGFKSQQPEIQAKDYLGSDVSASMRMMFGYDAATGFYTQVTLDTTLEPGSGYWMAVGTNGTIYPPAS